MSFSKNLTISVRNTAAQLSEPLYVYEKDRNLIMYFKIMDHKYKFDKNPTNVLASMDDMLSAYVTIVDPNGYELTHQNGEVIDDEIKFVITDELIDEITEIGTYQLQFHIKCEHGEFTIPPISFEVLERLKGIKSIIDESEVGDVITNDSESFIDEEGKLQIVWQKGDTISSVKLNQMVEVVNNAVDEEHLRKLNEQERVDKENERVDKENERIANEDVRTANENARIENENTRVTSESTRLSNEVDRIANEDERKAKETLRQSEENKRQTNEQTRIQNEENRVTAESARVASMNDITTRFNDLIASLPQYPEVIDARDGEVSLKARLDRDIEKAKQVYVNVEGSYITTDSSSGYAKDVEILGNTIQDPNNLADIRSVGDKVEGQELYEIPVVSCGKNLLDNDKLVEGHWINKTTGDFASDTTWKATEEFIEILPNQEYTIITEIPSGTNPGYALYDTTKRYISGGKNGYFVTPSNAKYLRLTVNTGKTAMLCLGNVSISEPYEPYQEDKLTILSPVQLEKVGDVADRIIEKDGVWGVEKNVETVVLNGSEGWAIDKNNTTVLAMISTKVYGKNGDLVVSTINSHFRNFTGGELWIGDIEGVGLATTGSIKVNILKSKLSTQDVQGFKQWLQANPVTVKYQLATPTFIPLPHDQQVKLRTFANKTNISFLTEIEGTIKAQVPKSLGATVNTHTEQIGNLNKELDRVKKLEESTVSTVTTENDITTVEATSNGYFEDVKLEGKTLVNLFDYSTPFNTHWKDITISQGFKPNTKYTFIIQSSGDASSLMLGVLNTSGNWSCLKEPYDVGSSIFMLTTDSNPTNTIRMGTLSPSEVVVTYNKILILEGDHTQNPPSYFEGIKSVGQDVDEIEVLSSNVFYKAQLDSFNLEPAQSNYGYDEGRRVAYSSLNLLVNMNFSEKLIDALDTQIPYLPNTNLKLLFEAKGTVDRRFEVTFFDSNQVLIKKTALRLTSLNTWNVLSCDIPSNARYFSIRTIYMSSQPGICFIDLDTIIINENFKSPLQSDKKRLLYYNNETQAWEKPILRQWDSIEKHADGKYYYHQRSAEVVLNGNESWEKSGYTIEGYSSFYTNGPNNFDNNYICDKFNVMSFTNWNSSLASEFTCAGNSNIHIRLLSSKLSTQDVAGFKQWLQANPVTVVYQLAKEKVYECTNIDLITYANETNYIVNSGPIVPRTTLKVHNNISNVVSLLQKKVSILESNFVVMFKAILAGDYQTLAYSLYPEDFNTEPEVSNTDESNE